ncbi:MAG: tetratricopeptide repeat protein [Candidatus Obscuribacterales bacterium]
MRKRNTSLILSVLPMVATPGLAAPALEATATWDQVTGEAIAASQRGNFEVAEKQFEKACKLAKSSGAAPEQLASSLNGLARVNAEQGNYKRAGELFSKALELAKNAKNSNNLQIASIESDIGTMYNRQGKATLAEPFFKSSLEKMEKQFGPRNERVARAQHQLGGVYLAMGELTKAETLLLTSQRFYESEHRFGFEYIAASNTLAQLYSSRGEYKKALSLMEKALALAEMTSGPRSFEVANCLIDLGNVYTAEAMDARRTNKPDHFKVRKDGVTEVTLTGTRNILLEKAEPLFKHALAIFRDLPRPDHLGEANCLINLGLLYVHREDPRAAEDYYRQALAITEKYRGPESLETATALSNLAEIYHTQKKEDEATELLGRAIKVFEKRKAKLQLASTLYNLGLIQEKCGRLSLAEKSFSRTLSIMESSQGQYHKSLLMVLPALAKVYARQGKTARAEQLYQRAIDISMRAFGPIHQEVAFSMERYAEFLREDRRSNEAEHLEKRAEKIREKLRKDQKSSRKQEPGM